MTTRETVRVEGTVRSGERFEVELFVGGDRVASGASGDCVTVSTNEDGVEIEVDVSSLSLAELDSTTHRGTWSELEGRPEAALVADRSPAPHVKASLVVRRLSPGVRLAVDGVVTERSFNEATTNRVPVTRRIQAVRALRTSPAVPAPIRSEVRTGWWLALPRVFAAAVLAGNGLVVLLHPNLRAALVSAALSVSMLATMRFARRALTAVPALDKGLAHPVPRVFARGARSLPRFAPAERDVTNLVARYFGPVVALGLCFVAFIAVVWPAAVLTREIHANHLSATGSGGIVGAQALVLAVLALAYWLADHSELPRVRSLLDAIGGSGSWRARRGTIAAGDAEELLHRGVFIETDSTIAEDTTFHATNNEGGAATLDVITDQGTVVVQTSGLAWASDDVRSTARAARIRVRKGARALVAGFDDGETLVARGPASMMLYAVMTGSPEEALRAALNRRRGDAIAAAVSALVVGALALLIVVL